MNEIIDKLLNMSIGQIETFNEKKSYINKCVKEIDGNFKVMGSSSQCAVLKLGNTKTTKSFVYQECNRVGFLDRIPIHGNSQYIRVLVSQFNKEFGRNVKVNEIDGLAHISEDFEARESITKNEYWMFKAKCEELDKLMKMKIEHEEFTESDLI